jgi:hypothetical protein
MYFDKPDKIRKAAVEAKKLIEEFGQLGAANS